MEDSCDGVGGGGRRALKAEFNQVAAAAASNAGLSHTFLPRHTTGITRRSREGLWVCHFYFTSPHQHLPCRLQKKVQNEVWLQTTDRSPLKRAREPALPKTTIPGLGCFHLPKAELKGPLLLCHQGRLQAHVTAPVREIQIFLRKSKDRNLDFPSLHQLYILTLWSVERDISVWNSHCCSPG